MGSTINFGKRIGGPAANGPKLVTPPDQADGQWPADAEANRGPKFTPNPKTPSGRTASLVRRRKDAGSSVA